VVPNRDKERAEREGGFGDAAVGKTEREGEAGRVEDERNGENKG